MKRSIFMFLVIGVTLIFFGCSENNSTAPELSQSDQATTSLAKTKTPFTATAVIDCEWSDASPGTKKILPNGDIHFRGVKAKFNMHASNDLLDGAMLWTTNKNIEEGMIKAKLWGKIELIVAKGKWELTWHGYKIGRMVTIDANGVGVEGDVKGMVTKMTMEMKLPSNPCVKEFDIIAGYISK